MDPALEDIKDQLEIAKSNLDGAFTRAQHTGDLFLIENIKRAQEALLRIHNDELDEERIRNSEYREIIELEEIEKKAETLLEALQRDIKRK